MKFGRNIMLSVAIHATLITVAAGFVAGRDAGFRVPEKVITIALLEGLKDHRPSLAPAREKIAGAKTSAEAAEKNELPMRMMHEEKPQQKSFSSPPQAGEKKEMPTDGGRQEVPGYNSAGTVHKSPLQGGGDALRGNPGALSSVTAATVEGGSYGTSGIGRQDPDVIKKIRAAIERAKGYPLLAQKRGLEGTSTTEFTINSKGHPENIRIAQSSGSDILDTAAKNTVIRASPFPSVGGIIEIPITFRLKRE